MSGVTALFNQEITQQAYQISFNEVFFMLGVIFFALVLVIFLAKPPFTARGGAAAGGGH